MSEKLETLWHVNIVDAMYRDKTIAVSAGLQYLAQNHLL
jgi:hypothetical protein